MRNPICVTGAYEVVISKVKHLLRKTGIPLAEMTRNVADHQKKRSIFVPAEQIAVIEVLDEILKEIKGLREDLKKK